MPYKKRYSKKQCKTPLWGKADREIARAAYNMAKKAHKFLNVEFKAHTILSTSTVIPDGAGTIIQLSNISEGNSAITRDGQQIKVTSIFFNAHVRMHSSATQSLVTVMLIRDNSTNQAIYTTGDLLENVANIASVQSPPNINNTSRFRILKRWIFKLDSASNTSKYFSHNFALQQKIRFDANDGTITDLTKSSLSLLFISDESTNTPTIRFYHRLRFVDN